MNKLPLTLLFSAALSSGSVQAETPRVVTDVFPVQMMVARVMDGVGAPEVLLEPGADPHSYSLKPSQANALSQSDIVFWVGSDLAPWLEKPIDTLAANALAIQLLESSGTEKHMFREDIAFEFDDDEHHDEEHAHDDEEEHDEHGEEHADDHHDEDHAESEEDHHHHDGEDPHAWLGPKNASVWLNVIASALSEKDPENSELYTSNADQGTKEIEAVVKQINNKLASVSEKPFFVYHDAYQYFETAFGLKTTAAMSIGDATKPGPARIAALRELVQEKNVKCVVVEPAYSQNLVNTVFEGVDVKVVTADPLGATLEATSYTEMLEQLADRFIECLK